MASGEATKTEVKNEAMRTPSEKRDFSEEKPPMFEQSLDNIDSSIDIEATVDDFVDTHGPSAMRNDYKDTNGGAIQAPKLARDFWEQLYGDEYPYEYDETNDSTTIFDLSASENAADYIVIYNYALLIRDAD